MREGHLKMDLDTAAALLDGIDEIRVFLKQIHNEGNDGKAAPEELMARLHTLVPEKPDNEPAAVIPQPDEAISNAVTVSEDKPGEASESASPEAQDKADERETGTDSSTSGSSTPSESTVRVDVVLLDKLMNVVGELVLTRNQLLQHASSQNDAQLVNLSQRLNLVTS